jgi:hypothetical protein
LQSARAHITSEKVAKPGNCRMMARFLSWLHHTVTDLSEKAVDEALDRDTIEPVDYEILGDPRHPQFREMQRRHHAQQARDERANLD